MIIAFNSNLVLLILNMYEWHLISFKLGIKKNALYIYILAGFQFLNHYSQVIDQGTTYQE